jgi:hypothetical protein
LCHACNIRKWTREVFRPMGFTDFHLRYDIMFMMCGAWIVIHLRDLLTKPPEFAARTVVPSIITRVVVVDARGIRYVINKCALNNVAR